MEARRCSPACFAAGDVGECYTFVIRGNGVPSNVINAEGRTSTMVRVGVSPLADYDQTKP